MIRLCNDVIDEMMGAKEVAAGLEEELGIRFGETTPDGRFSLEWTSCIGMSDQAPAALVNDVVVTELHSDRARELVLELKTYLAEHGDPGDLKQRVRALGVVMVNRDPAAWGGYVPRPLKLAPRPSSLLAQDLAADVERNLDYEIANQAADGSWAPYWSWGDAFPDSWVVAKREWCGRLTFEALRSLRAFDRIEGV